MVDKHQISKTEIVLVLVPSFLLSILVFFKIISNSENFMFLIIEFVLLINIFGFFFKPHTFFFLNLIINFFIFISLIAAIVVEILSLQFRNVTFVLPILLIIAIIIMPVVLIKTKKKIYRSSN
jgi:hypothetical protein